MEAARILGDGLDITSGEHVETDLDNLITRRDEKRCQSEGERRIEDLWMPSVRRYQEKLRRAELEERIAYHSDQLERHRHTFDSLREHHERELTRRREELARLSGEERA